MKALLLNGSPHESGCTYTALKEVADTLRSNGVQTELLWIGAKPIPGCIGCRKCKITGMCVFQDQVNEIHKRMDEFQAIIVGSPVYYGGPSGQIKCFLDRLFQSSANVWPGKLGAAVVSCRRGGASTAFQSLNMYFTMSKMQVVGSQYWNQVHGSTPEDVKKDEEGMQTMRSLGQNVAWILKSMESANRDGVEAPVYEERLSTNFIR